MKISKPYKITIAMAAVIAGMGLYMIFGGRGFNEEYFVRRNISQQAKRRAFYFNLGSVVDDPKRALEYYKKAIEIDPYYSESHRLMGMMKRDMGDLDGAIADITRSIELATREYEYIGYLSRGEVYMRMGKYDDAIRDFDAAIAIEGNFAIYYNRGEAKAKNSDYKAAIKDFDIGVKLAQKEQTQFVRILWLKRAAAKAALKDYRGALADLDLILSDNRMRDMFGAAYHMKSDIYKAMGDQQKAMENFMKADEYKFYQSK